VTTWKIASLIALAALISGCAAQGVTLPTATAHAVLEPPPAVTAIAPAVPAEPTAATTPAAATPQPVDEAALTAALPEVTLDVELFYTERWMRAVQTVEMPNTTPDAWSEIVFNTPINHIPDAFYLDALTVTLGAEVQEGTPPLIGTDTILRVPLPRPALPGETVTIEMRYRVVIPPLPSTDWPPSGTTGWTFDLIQAGEWYPSLVPYIAGAGWLTWEYRPVGDPTVYPLVNCTLIVRTEPEVTIVSGSVPVRDQNGAWRFRMERARGIAFLASDRYESASAEANGIPVTSTYLPEHAAAGQAALEIAVQSLLLFEELYGPYPYESLTVAENGFFGGMEYTALASITDYAYLVYPGGAPSLLHALVAHEIAHQWWYGAVGNDQTTEPWLDESLAFYSELLYFERYYPEAIDWWWETRVSRYDPSGPVDATIYSYDDSERFILSMYGQAARFMRDLRALMGDEAFFAFVRDYYETFRWRMVTADDFFAAARRHTGEDLAPLLEAYFANPEH
jgi:hypothetical protein